MVETDTVAAYMWGEMVSCVYVYSMYDIAGLVCCSKEAIMP